MSFPVPERKEASLLLLLFLTEFARGAFFFTFLPFWTVNYLGFSVTVVGFAVSAQYLTETLFKTFAGWQFDRLGKPVLVGGLTLSFLSLLVLKQWPAPAVLVACAGLFGLGFSPLWLGVISNVAPVETPRRATKISMVFACWLAGAGSGMVSVNFLMAKNYHAVFTLVAALWVFSLLIAWFSSSSPKRRPGPAAGKPPGIWDALKRMATNKIMTHLLFPGMFFQTLAAGLLLPVLPLFVQQYLHLDHNQYAVLLLAGGAAAVLSLPPMGHLADRLALKYLLGSGFGLSGLFLGFFACTREATGAFPLAVLLGISYAMILPAWNSLLARIIPPESQATGWGVFATIEGLGITVGPALGGLAARLIGMPGTLLATTAVLLTASLFYFFYPVESLLVKN